MTVANIKDSSRLEVVRFVDEDDPVFFSSTNRPHEDIEQRTKDLDLIFTPARGFRVRQTATASASVEVEAGVYVDALTINQVSLQAIAIPATTAGNIRVDLIYFNLSTGAGVRVAGPEVATGSGFAAAKSAHAGLPAGTGSTIAIPLAYLYVDETPTPFARGIAPLTAGGIEDVRPAIPASSPMFETTLSNILTDATGGSLGTLTTVARANHRHPLNVDGVLPATITATVTAGSVGSAGTYARRDHTHPLAIETSAAVLLGDTAGGAVGTSGNLVRADHRHPLNVSVNPADLLPDASGGSLGTSSAYARANHQHPLNVPTSGTPVAVNPASVPTHGVAGTYSPSDHRHAVEGVLQARQSGGVTGVALWGEVTSAGAVKTSGSGGWSVVRNSLGNYTVTFSPAIDNTPIITGTPFEAFPATRKTFQVFARSTTSFDVFTADSGGSAVDTDFFFMVMYLKA